MLTADPNPECDVCHKPFFRILSTQKVCSVRCAQRVPVLARKAARVVQKAEIVARKVTRAQREAIKRSPELLIEAQKAFNDWVRARDAGKPCICCGNYSQGAGSDRGGEWDAGHFRSRGAAPEMRFVEDNCHAQLKQCNRRAWDVAAYRRNLIERIGLAAVEKVESPHPPTKYTRDDLRAIRDDYRQKLKAMNR